MTVIQPVWSIVDMVGSNRLASHPFGKIIGHPVSKMTEYCHPLLFVMISLMSRFSSDIHPYYGVSSPAANLFHYIYIYIYIY